MKLKLKYYLRGLGLGIVVTAVIMSITKSKDNKMTDEEIKARAKQLGMIESTVLIESSPKEDNDVQEPDNNQPDADVSDSDVQADAIPQLPDTEDDADADTQDAQNDTDPAEESVQDPQNDADPAEESVQDPQSDTDPTDGSVQDTQNDADMTETGAPETTLEFPKVIVISSGEGSYTVSKRLAEIGAVESAADFDTYLCEHGYDKKIRAGTYTIPVGATNEQMAKIVTGAKITE